MDPDDFTISLQATIGVENSEDGEVFEFLVCTPQWLMRSVADHKVVFARHHLIVETYSYSVIHGAIESMCNRTWGDTWHDIALKLSRYGLWNLRITSLVAILIKQRRSAGSPVGIYARWPEISPGR